jgi:succinate dehydrogenase/fumarate reductase-like Fe-S protein
VFTLQRDSRDAAHAERGEALLSEDVLARCHGQANCTAVCPMQLSPTDSILALRRRAVMRLFGFPQR